VLRSGPNGEPVRSQASQLAQAVCAMAMAARVREGVLMGERKVPASGGEYHVQAVFVGASLWGAPCVLTTLLPPPGDPSGWERLRTHFRLTRAQTRVAQLLIQGLRNAEIAERLFLSEHTVRHHIEQIRTKVGGHTRAAVAARLRQQA
jgi:DNA-binding CsgD family transcriptional regulator